MMSAFLAPHLENMVDSMLFGTGSVSAADPFPGFALFVGFACLFWVLIIILWILVCVWVYKDATARGEEGALWLIITLFAGPIGLIVWLLVRPPIGHVRPIQMYPGPNYWPPPQAPPGNYGSHHPPQPPPPSKGFPPTK
ncbi:MAG: hypothetical protein QCI38_04435 [Candidatus Thermoplasmatota archaeon]|nr:hypothetical protein [Candidatus Thermoplasmatota archaeon]